VGGRERWRRRERRGESSIMMETPQPLYLHNVQADDEFRTKP
jgi:hypothetical protein